MFTLLHAVICLLTAVWYKLAQYLDLFRILDQVFLLIPSFDCYCFFEVSVALYCGNDKENIYIPEEIRACNFVGY
jgi:hypothetical protein